MKNLNIQRTLVHNTNQINGLNKTVELSTFQHRSASIPLNIGTQKVD